jgi:DNA-binding NarL/FixJ family response regulator
MSKIRVFLADDHELVRDSLKALIDAQADMTVVGQAADGPGACERVLQLGRDVDLVVLDVSLPGLGGAEVTGRLKRARPEIAVLALSFHEDRAYVRRLLDAGATGYLVKREVADEVLRAIRVVAGGGTYLDAELAAKVAGDCAPAAAQAAAPIPAPAEETVPALSPREERVIRLVARGCTGKEIAAQLGLGAEAIERHKARAMQKLGLGSRAEVVRYATWRGWV